jgi:hypothetical protein
VEGGVTPPGYVIDVCRYCGRLAVWPGCEHWQLHEGWCMPVHVKLMPTERARLQRAMREAAR